jgi:hypothetical protein
METNLIWRIEGYDGVDKVLDQILPLRDADEIRVGGLLKGLASAVLTPGEIDAGYADVRKFDDDHGNHIVLRAGKNPRFVASLCRPEEIDCPNSNEADFEDGKGAKPYSDTSDLG